MRKVIAAVLVVVMLLSLTACTPQKKVLGTWKQTDALISTTYTFNDDGTGVRSLGVNVNFTYTIDDEFLKITTTAAGFSYTETYTYVFDGDKLTLTSDLQTIELTKVK